MSATLDEATRPDEDGCNDQRVIEAGDTDSARRSSERLDTLGLYLRDIERYPLLTPAEERRLAERVAAGDPDARERLICSNLRLVVSIARRYQGYGLPLLDLVQAGSEGLIHAIGKFDVTRGFKLSTYATPWIEQRIQRAIGNEGTTIRLPIHRGVEVRALRRAEARLAAEGTEATDERLAVILETTVAAVAEARRMATVSQTISLDQPLSAEDPDGADLGAMLTNDQSPDPSQELEEAEQGRELESGLDALTRDERRVVELRFGLGDQPAQDLLTTAKRLRLDRQAVRRLERSALRKLGDPSALRAA